jgi:hypothetical protein
LINVGKAKRNVQQFDIKEMDRYRSEKNGQRERCIAYFQDKIIVNVLK